MSELPEPWVTWASRVGVRASLTGIGEAAGGLPASTVSRLVHQGKTSQATVEAVASALRVDVATVLEAATGASGHGTWRPPLESHLLTPPERDALAVIIRAMTSGRSGAGADLHAVPDWARSKAARTSPEPKGVPEAPGEEDVSQDPGGWDGE